MGKRAGQIPMPHELVDALAGMREAESLELTQRMLDDGADPAVILTRVREAMDIVGRRFEEGEYFLPELILSGEIVRQISDVVKPQLAEAAGTERSGRVLIGTVQGDVHDVGKNIVVFMLEVSGFDVHDLGVDVPPERFVDAIREYKPHVVGLSGLLTVAYGAMRRTVDAIKAAGLYDDVKIMIGGGRITGQVRDHTGAHAYGDDAMVAVRLARGWVEGT